MRANDVEILGKRLVDLGFRVEEPDDHVVALYLKDTRLAVFYQIRATKTAIRYAAREAISRLKLWK